MPSPLAQDGHGRSLSSPIVLFPLLRISRETGCLYGETYLLRRATVYPPSPSPSACRHMGGPSSAERVSNQRVSGRALSTGSFASKKGGNPTILPSAWWAILCKNKNIYVIYISVHTHTRDIYKSNVLDIRNFYIK